MKRSSLAGALLAALVAAGVVGEGSARASACGDARDPLGGPLAGGTLAADFGAIPDTCARTELELRVRGTALVASTMPDYYGSIAAGAMVRLRHRLGSRTTLSLAADLSTFRYVVNAVAISDGVSFGPPTLGLYRELGDGELSAASVYARVLLPPDTARQNGVGLGFELGMTFRRRLGGAGRAGVQGGAAMLSPMVVVAGQTHAALQPVALAEAWYALTPRFAVFGGAEGRAELSPSLDLLTIAPRIALRRAIPHDLGLALLAEVPVTGQDRTDVIIGLYLGWSPPQ